MNMRKIHSFISVSIPKKLNLNINVQEKKLLMKKLIKLALNYISYTYCTSTNIRQPLTIIELFKIFKTFISDKVLMS